MKSDNQMCQSSLSHDNEYSSFLDSERKTPKWRILDIMRETNFELVQVKSLGFQIMWAMKQICNCNLGGKEGYIFLGTIFHQETYKASLDISKTANQTLGWPLNVIAINPHTRQSRHAISRSGLLVRATFDNRQLLCHLEEITQYAHLLS